MEPASVLRALNPMRLILGLSTGAVVGAALARPMDLDDYQSVSSVTPLLPADGWVKLGAYDMQERVFRGCFFELDEAPPEERTTQYRRVCLDY